MVSSSRAKYLVMTPVSGEVISTVTLSVSILAIISSALTNSPGSLWKNTDVSIFVFVKVINVSGNMKLTLDELFDNSFGDGVSHGGNWNDFAYITNLRSISITFCYRLPF